MTQDDITQVCQWAEGYISEYGGPTGSTQLAEAYRTLSRVRLALGVQIPGVPLPSAQQAPVASQGHQGNRCQCTEQVGALFYRLNPLCPIHGDSRDTSYYDHASLGTCNLCGETGEVWFNAAGQPFYEHEACIAAENADVRPQP